MELAISNPIPPGEAGSPESNLDLKHISLLKTSNEDQNQDVLILGVGNPLMGDDGVGIRIIEILAGKEMPPNVTLQEAGIPGWGLPSWFEGKTNVILVDAMHMGQTPGSWKRFLPEEIRLEITIGAPSLHQHDLACGLALSQALGLLPENLLFYGIEPADLTPDAPLSPAVHASLPEVIDSIMQEVKNILI